MTTMRVTLCSLFVLALAAFSPTQFTYTVEDLGTLGGDSSAAHAVNIDGHIVGMSRNTDGNEHAFLWKEGIMEDLETLRPGEAIHSEAYWVNVSDVVVGRADSISEEWGYVTRAFIWEDGVMSDLGTLGGPHSTAFAINDLGMAVGWADLAADGPTHAALWYGGRTKDLGSMGRDLNSFANGISSNGIIVGLCEADLERNAHACIWTGSRPHDLGTLGGIGSTAFAVNRHAEVVGASQNADGEWHAFLWKEGTMLDLGTLGGASSWAIAINDSSQIVGFSRNAEGGQDGFIWADGTMTALPNLGGSCGAEGINDSGTVVGNCSIPATAEGHAVLWTQ